MGATAFLAIFLVLQPWTAARSDFVLSPLLSPIFEKVCKEVECGRGTCKPADNSTFGFQCECSPGWKQAFKEDDDQDNLKFLPCVIPNCSLDYTCSKSPAPVQEKDNRTNTSIFDVCHWSECGGGTCNKTSALTRTCECSEGYYNLFNVTTFPCFRDCSLGMDCKNLGIPVTNKSTSSQSPSLSSNGSNQPNSLILRGNFNWLITVLMFLAVFLVK